jgi:hypothetical protein
MDIHRIAIVMCDLADSASNHMSHVEVICFFNDIKLVAIKNTTPDDIVAQHLEGQLGIGAW